MIQILDVVDGERTIPRCELGAAEVGELFGMELDGQAKGPGGTEDLFGFSHREGDALAEGVHGIGKACMGRSGQGLLADQSDVILAPVLVFLRNAMRQGRSCVPRPAFAPKLPGHPEHFQFGVDIEPIARLYLDRCDAFHQ